MEDVQVLVEAGLVIIHGQFRCRTGDEVVIGGSNVTSAIPSQSPVVVQ